MDEYDAKMRAKLEREYNKKMENSKAISDQLEEFKIQTLELKYKIVIFHCESVGKVLSQVSASIDTLIPLPALGAKITRCFSYIFNFLMLLKKIKEKFSILLNTEFLDDKILFFKFNIIMDF